jgi:DNA-binding transcriptional MerR regulator
MQKVEDELLPTRKVRARYHKTDRTILRWERDGILPPPVWINGRKHWRLSDLERLERERVGEHTPITED